MSTTTLVPTTCGICRSNGCGILAHVEGDRVVKVTGNPDHPMNRGTICPRGAAALEAMYSPHRILHPMKRVGPKGSGDWKPISWDEALNLVADGLLDVVHKHGPLSACGVIGSPNRTHNTTVMLLMRMLGSPNVMADTDLCSGGNWLGSMLSTGGSVGRMMWNPDVRNTRCLLVAGGNPFVTKNPQWNVDWSKARAEGAKLIVIDPRRTEVARRADLFLQIRPGSDAALALAMTNVIIEESLYDGDFVEKWCHGFDGLRERAKEYAPEEVENVVDISALEIRQAARLFATTKPGGIWFGLGLIQNANSVQTHRAYINLMALTGNIDVPGGNLLPKRCPGFKGNWELWHENEWRLPPSVEASTIGSQEFPLWAGPESYTKSSYNASVIDAVLTGEPYPVRAFYVSGANIVLTYPNSRRVLDAVNKLHFLAVSEYEMTPVAEVADIVLPKAHWLENGPDAVDNPYSKCISAHRRTVEPLGSSRDEAWIAIELAKRLAAKDPAVDRRFLRWDSPEEFFGWRLEGTGIDEEQLLERGFASYEPTRLYREYQTRGFRTPTGKVEFWSVTLDKFGYDPLPSFIGFDEFQLNTRYPLLLLTGCRTRAYQHSRFRDSPTLRKMEPNPFIEMHPEAASSRGIRHGEWALVETSVAGEERAKFMVRVTEDIRPDTVSVPMGWWYVEAPGPEHNCFESNTNVLVREGIGFPHDPITGAPLARGLRCQVTRVTDAGEHAKL